MYLILWLIGSLRYWWIDAGWLACLVLFGCSFVFCL